MGGLRQLEDCGLATAFGRALEELVAGKNLSAWWMRPKEVENSILMANFANQSRRLVEVFACLLSLRVEVGWKLQGG